ncbi:MAG: LamG domain-containing protein, partial [Candidatus Nealsonbacteria bacterium]|nr:LamG domain-containing protein [Candidatus Nealsonbacteria bacterium]
ADGTYNASVDWASPVWVDNAFNGNAVMRFDGTNQQRLSFTEYMDMESVLWVVKENEGAIVRAPVLGDDIDSPFNRGAGGRGEMWQPGWASNEVKDGVTTLNGTQVDGTVVPPPTEMGIVGLVMTGPATGVDDFGLPSNGIPVGVSHIGQDRFEDERSWDGDIADIIIYDRQLSTAEMDQMTRHLAFRYSIPVEQPMEDFSGVDMTVTADSTLEVGGTVDVGLAGLTLKGGTLTTSGSANSINFTGVTVDVDPASELEAGLNALTATTYGAGPLELKHGVIKTTGNPVTFNGVNIPNTATAVGFNPHGGTTYGTIQGNNTSAVISKTGSSTMVLNSGDAVNFGNATLDAKGGTLALGGNAAWSGATEARLSGGTIQLFAGTVPEGTAGLIGAWLFDEGAGDIAQDSTLGGNHGNITGAEWVTDPVRGTVLSFNGADWVDVPTAAALFQPVEAANKISIAFWTYGDPDIQPQSNTIFSAARGTSRVAMSHLPWDPNNPTIYWDSGDSYDRINKAADGDFMFEGQWNHWVYTKENGSAQIFFNGDLWHSGGGTRLLQNIDRFVIGAEYGYNNNYDGMIDEFLVYDRVLSEAEIEDLMDNGLTFPTLPAISMLDKNFTVTADSSIVAASDTTAAFGDLMLESGSVRITGAPDGVSFTSLTVNAPGSEGGVNLGTSATFGGPVALQAGVL